MTAAVLTRPSAPSRAEGQQRRPHPHKTLREVLAARRATMVTAAEARVKADIANRFGDEESERFYDGLHQDLWEQARRSASEYSFGALGLAGL